MKTALVSLLFLLLSVTPALAHPGRTSSDGCHYCRTNCDKWGEVWDERHCHPRSSKAPTVAPTRIPTPTRKMTPTPTVEGESASSSDLGGLLTVLGIGGGAWYWFKKRKTT